MSTKAPSNHSFNDRIRLTDKGLNQPTDPDESVFQSESSFSDMEHSDNQRCSGRPVIANAKSTSDRCMQTDYDRCADNIGLEITGQSVVTQGKPRSDTFISTHE